MRDSGASNRTRPSANTRNRKSLAGPPPVCLISDRWAPLSRLASTARAFGTKVVDLVLEVTDVYTTDAYSHLNRKARKELETERLATVSAEAKLIRLADIADNTSSIVEREPGFARVYHAAKAAMQKVLLDLEAP